MASAQTLEAVISVLDRTAEPLRQINARFAGMTAPLHRVSSAIGEIAEQSGLKNIGHQAAHVLERVRGLGRGLLDLAGPLAALGAGASLGGLAEVVKSTAEFAEKLQISSKLTGVATDQMAGWHYAAGLVNVDSEQLDKSFGRLNKNLGAGGEQSKQMRAALGQLGVAVRPGQLVNTAATLGTVSAKIKDLVDGGHMQQATYLLTQLFGKGGMTMLPLLEQGPEKIAEAMAAAKAAGLTLTESQSEAGAIFMEKYKAMAASVEGLKLAIGSDLMPVLTPVIEATREWLNANREWLSTEIKEAVVKLGGALKSIDWQGIGRDIGSIAAGAKWVVEEVGGIGPAIGIVAGLKLAGPILEIGKLGSAIAMAAGKIGLLMVANPVGAVIAGVALLAGAAYWVYENWDWCKKKLAAIWEWFGNSTWAQTALAVIAPFIGIPLAIYEHWGEVKQFFADLWDKITSIFDGAWAKIGPIVNKIRDAVSWISDKVGKISSAGFGGGGSVEFGGAGGALPETPRAPLSAQPGAAAAAGAAGQSGSQTLTVNIPNLPQGGSVSTETRGNATPLDLNVGYAFPLN